MSATTPCGTADDPLVIAMRQMKAEIFALTRPQRILLVEDEKVMRMLFGRWSEKFNCDVVYSSTGEQGLELALNGGFDLIILDINLPGMNGIEVFKEVRRLLGDIPPVAFFTGTLNDSDGMAISSTGFASFIRKPQEFNERFIASFFHNFRIFRKPEPTA